MLTYVDTSILVAAHVREPHTALAQTWLTEQGSGGLIVSTWALLECESALVIKVRRGELDSATQAAVMADIDALVADLAPFAAPQAADHARARELCRHAPSGLRAGDALHLAHALRLQADRFATLDRTLANNAAAHGLTLAIPMQER